MSLRIGALFAGYGGLDLAVSDVLDAEIEWYAEIEPDPSKILAHHYPGVPNLGDVTKVDWASLPPVDIITGGSPCQDLSHAGKRKGMKAGTRSGLWAAMCDAIEIIQPTLVVWENVRGALSAEADSAMESCPRCLGDPGDREPLLRALGRVLGDLAELGYDARWYGLRAADVGGAHGRFRIFVVAAPANAPIERLLPWTRRWDGPGAPARAGAAGGAPGPRGLRARQVDLLPTPTTDDAGNVSRDSGDFQSLTREVVLLPTPRAVEGSKGSPNQRDSTGHETLSSAVHLPIDLLPTPTATDGNGGPMTVEQREANGYGPTLRDVPNLLPTPTASDWKGSTKSRREPGQHRGQLDALTEGLLSIPADELLPTPTTDPDSANGHARHLAGEARTWRQYLAAIKRAEAVVGREAPPPTQTAAKGGQALSARFTEWLMMLPEGWVTAEEIGLGRNAQLKALGNGVVPPQAAAALRAYLVDEGLDVAVPHFEETTPDVLLPTPNPFHMGNNEEPDDWRRRRLDVFERTGTRHGPALTVVAKSIADGNPLVPDNYMPDPED